MAVEDRFLLPVAPWLPTAAYRAVVESGKRVPISRHSSGWIRTTDLTIMSGAL